MIHEGWVVRFTAGNRQSGITVHVGQVLREQSLNRYPIGSSPMAMVVRLGGR